ncbi:MAG TPA: DUF5615 family PIN-like protein [Tepidisphaeraceae bacterium]|nr:DUF5615 family PIN-like protein [Tepidisphaeraceae bacterium]
MGITLLFDENLSPRLTSQLADIFPGSASVDALDVRGSADEQVWARAVRDGHVIVTRDNDFVARSALLGHPPKVIRVALGNCSTAQVESLIRWRLAAIQGFVADPDAACLELT